MEGATPIDDALPSARRTREGETQSGDGDRAGADGIYLGDRARGVTDAVTERAARTCSFIGFLGGTVTRWRILEDVKGVGFGRDVRA